MIYHSVPSRSSVIFTEKKKKLPLLSRLLHCVRGCITNCKEVAKEKTPKPIMNVTLSFNLLNKRLLSPRKARDEERKPNSIIELNKCYLNAVVKTQFHAYTEVVRGRNDGSPSIEARKEEKYLTAGYSSRQRFSIIHFGERERDRVGAKYQLQSSWNA